MLSALLVRARGVASLFPFAVCVAALPLSIVACSDAGLGNTADSSPEGTTEEAITDVNHSSVKRQSIGNCWIYATASWAEAMNRNANKLAGTPNAPELNLSESYVTFWHWFEQIVGNDLDKGQIQTGGSWEEATALLSTYGVVAEADFIKSEATAEMSYRQDEALDAINLSLKSGALKTAAARKNRTLVRSELARAWRLTTTVTKALDAIFGASVGGTASRPLTASAATFVRPTSAVAAAYTPGPGLPMVQKTLATAITEWRTARYPSLRSGNSRSFEKRFQRALHDNQPVIISWFVDFNSLDDQGRFFAPPATPGHQGGHMTVMEDYEVTTPKFGTLPAGVLETRPEALADALTDGAKISFIRIKNSWGSERADRGFVVPGYHDLYMKYLNGPVKACAEKADGSPDTSSCYDRRPFGDVVLPPGY